jgi:glycosidase
MMAEQPARAVTFVENHDYQFGRALDSHVREWIKPIAYAFILLRPGGYPCIFYGDYTGPSRETSTGHRDLSALARLPRRWMNPLPQPDLADPRCSGRVRRTDEAAVAPPAESLPAAPATVPRTAAKLSKRMSTTRTGAGSARHRRPPTERHRPLTGAQRRPHTRAERRTGPRYHHRPSRF